MQLLLFVAILLSAADKLWAGQICCPGLGCYDDKPPYDGLPLPDCPENMGMVIKMYTRRNPNVGKNITRNKIPYSFNGKLMTIFIVHGWTGSEKTIWLHEMKDAFLSQGDYNVIIVGWKTGAGYPWFEYPHSASNTRTAGGEIALIANNTIKRGHSSKALMYCVGHSLGAHVCGHAGQQGQFGRISGLDPAGPCFAARDLSAGLNPSCADLVDVIHTDGILLGTSRVMGHIDFYPNGGYSQPGCPPIQTRRLNAWKNFAALNNNIQLSGFPYEGFACSHARSHLFFLESIRTPCFLVHQSYRNRFLSAKFSAKTKSDIIQSMGFNAVAYPSRGKFNLTTNSRSPFCRG